MKKEQVSELERYASQLNSLTVLHHLTEKGCLKTLSSIIAALLSDNPYIAMQGYSKMTAHLLESHSRRVSGNLFADYIIAILCEDENEFSMACAKHELNDSLRNAFLSDVQILLQITQLNSEKIAEYINSTDAAKAADKITDLTSAVWGGSIAVHNNRNDNAFSLISWNYTETEPVVSYVNDEMLTGVYDTIITGDAQECVNALTELFENCGTGKHLRYRLFVSDEDKLLSGIDGSFLPDNLLPVLFSEQYAYLEESMRDFAEKGKRSNTVVCGAHGTGKTTMCLMTERSFPELGYVYVTACSMPNVKALFEKLSAQPLRFIVIFDDIQDFTEIKPYIGTFLQPENIMCICISDNETDCDIFDPATAAKYICDISFTDESVEAVRNMCMDIQIETKKALGFGAVKEILRKL